MAITININTPDATININSSEDSGYIIPDQEPSKKTPKNTGPHFLVTNEVVKNINCDHRENGRFNVSPTDIPSLYRCNRCDELIDLRTKYDPALVKKTIGYLWDVFQAMKTNNTDENLKKEVLDTLGISLYLLKEHMPKILEIINDKIPKYVMTRYPKYTPPPFTPNMNDPFFNSSEFSQFFDSKAEAPFPDLDKKDAPPKKDKKPPTKPKEQTPSSSK